MKKAVRCAKVIFIQLLFRKLAISHNVQNIRKHFCQLFVMGSHNCGQGTLFLPSDDEITGNLADDPINSCCLFTSRKVIMPLIRHRISADPFEKSPLPLSHLN